MPFSVKRAILLLLWLGWNAGRPEREKFCRQKKTGGETGLLVATSVLRIWPVLLKSAVTNETGLRDYCWLDQLSS